MWSDLQRKLKDHEMNLREREKQRKFSTMLDIYTLYVSKHLNKELLEKEMMRAAARGKTRCKAINLEDSAIKIDGETMDLLIEYTEHAIQRLFHDSRFKIIQDRKILYISFHPRQDPRCGEGFLC